MSLALLISSAFHQACLDVIIGSNFQWWSERTHSNATLVASFPVQKSDCSLNFNFALWILLLENETQMNTHTQTPMQLSLYPQNLIQRALISDSGGKVFFFPISMQFSSQWLRQNCSKRSKMNMYSLPLFLLLQIVSLLLLILKTIEKLFLFYLWKKLILKFWGKRSKKFSKKYSFFQRYTQSDSLHAESQHKHCKHHSHSG